MATRHRLGRVAPRTVRQLNDVSAKTTSEAVLAMGRHPTGEPLAGRSKIVRDVMWSHLLHHLIGEPDLPGRPHSRIAGDGTPAEGRGILRSAEGQPTRLAIGPR